MTTCDSLRTREALIEIMYSDQLPGHARKLARMFRGHHDSVLDVEDIIQAGAEVLVRTVDVALTKADPMAYLARAAQLRMLDYCKEQCSVIRVPARSQRDGKRVPVILSLDAPLGNGGDEENFTLLDLLAA